MDDQGVEASLRDKKHRRNRALLFWTGHGVICAAPSFVVALGSMYSQWPAITGMILGVCALIAVYTSLSTTKSLDIFGPATLFRRSVRLAAHLRLAASITMLGSMVFRQMRFDPLATFDLLCGAWAIELTKALLQLLGMRISSSTQYFYENSHLDTMLFHYPNSLVPTAVTTVITGLLWSASFVMLILVTLAALAVMRAIGRWRTPENYRKTV